MQPREQAVPLPVILALVEVINESVEIKMFQEVTKVVLLTRENHKSTEVPIRQVELLKEVLLQPLMADRFLENQQR